MPKPIPELATRAGELAERHGLRGYDAVHLASALEIDAEDTLLVTSDGRLTQAAHSLGLTTARLPAQPSAG
ncbi:MAG: type II toxin-antitoxin system VapC family toxin [Gaiellaceae bacterium]